MLLFPNRGIKKATAPSFDEKLYSTRRDEGAFVNRLEYDGHDGYGQSVHSHPIFGNPVNCNIYRGIHKYLYVAFFLYKVKAAAGLAAGK